MSELHTISKQDNEAMFDVIFVHGLGGDPFETWQHSANQHPNSWPYWLAEDIPSIAVHCLSYEASPTGWFGSSMPLIDRATNILTLFEARSIGRHPIVFVCHSLGGLVVKQTLRTALDLGDSDWRRIPDSTLGIVFLATPHTGSQSAGYLSAFKHILKLSVSTEELTKNAPALRDLNIWYRENAKRLEIATLSMFESQNTYGMRVVDEVSADAGQGVPRAIDADHFSICKPKTRSELVFGVVRNFLDKHIPTNNSLQPLGSEKDLLSASNAPACNRYFVSYSRRAKADSELATDLCDGLRSAGHEVFIDRGILVGTNWVAEIATRIEWCDFFVLLLSDISVESEMVLSEVRMVYRKRRKDGRPTILPIRVRYDGLLDYELDSYLSRIQYIRWNDAKDTSKVVSKIIATGMNSFEQRVAEASTVLVSDADEDNLGRPHPGEDLRHLIPAPGGTIKMKDDFYIRRPSDDMIEGIASINGETLAIKAPRQFGKSSLLIRYISKWNEYQINDTDTRKRFVLIDFQSFTDGELDTYSVLLTRIAEQLQRGFRLELSQVPNINSQSQLSNYIEDHIFPHVPPSLTLAFDEVDRVLGRPYQSDFFSMLRWWHNRRADPQSPWEDVNLAMVIATEPYLLIDSADRSPFNVATPIELKPFCRHSLDELNCRYNSTLSTLELDSLHELLQGHPFLTRLAFYRIATSQVNSFDSLDIDAAKTDGPFGDHLRSLLVLLQQHDGLLASMRQIVDQSYVPNDEVYYRLYGAGLVCTEDGKAKPSNLLYARFFKSLR